MLVNQQLLKQVILISKIRFWLLLNKGTEFSAKKVIDYAFSSLDIDVPVLRLMSSVLSQSHD